MITASSNGGSNYTPVEAGTYVARCYSMIHIGTVPDEYNGEKKMINKCRITFELPTEKKVFKEGEPERPMSISKEFTLSLNEKANLRKFLAGWRGKDFTEEEAKAFDVTKLIGVPCLLSVIHRTKKTGGVYADISSASTLPKGMTCPELVNPSFEFNYEPFDEGKFNSLPDFLKDKMRQSDEYKRATNQHHVETPAAPATNGHIDDLPF